MFRFLPLLLVTASLMGVETYYQARIPIVLEGRQIIACNDGIPRPSVILTAPAQGYFAQLTPDPSVQQDLRNTQTIPATAAMIMSLVVRLPAPGFIKGKVMLPGEGVLRTLPFTVDSTTPTASAQEFFDAQKRQLEWYRNLRLPGHYWFARSASLALAQPVFRNRDGEDLMGLFTGAKALSENLQLERTLPLNDFQSSKTVSIASLKGIETRPVEWKGLLPDNPRASEVLAKSIPADQHAIFFPSFGDMQQVMERLDTVASPLLRLTLNQDEDSGVRHRYQRQLCLTISEMGRLLGPLVIDRLAMTGSDPFLRLGSDVAVLMLPKQPEVLLADLQRRLIAARTGDVVAVKGTTQGIAWQGSVSPDRRVCAYLAQIGAVVVVTNSLAQLERLAQVASGAAPSMASTQDYTFMHERHGKDQAELIVPDAALRRWCSARSRIGDARRLKVLAALQDLQCEYMAGKASKIPEVPAAWQQSLGKISVGPSGVCSPLWGTVPFLIPIAELPLDQVTQEEANNYERFRSFYQRQWNGWFDPIGASVQTDAQSVTLNLSVFPLIGATDYREPMELVGKSHLEPGVGDPHDAIFQIVMAIDPDSKQMQDLNRTGKNMLSGMVKPFGWVGTSLSVYVDQDPLWQEMSEAVDPGRYFRENLSRLPLGIHVTVKDPLGLTAFLMGVRSLASQAAPGLVTFETRTYQEQSYVEIRGRDEQTRGLGVDTRIRLYYVTLPDALLLSLNKEVIHRAIDRSKADRKAAPYLGEHLAIRVRPDLLPPLVVALRRGLRHHGMEPDTFNSTPAQRWLPILNEWHRLFPDRDPVQVHEDFWGTRPLSSARFQTDAVLDLITSIPGTSDTIKHLEAGLTLDRIGTEIGLRSSIRLSVPQAKSE